MSTFIKVNKAKNLQKKKIELKESQPKQKAKQKPKPKLKLELSITFAYPCARTHPVYPARTLLTLLPITCSVSGAAGASPNRSKSWQKIAKLIKKQSVDERANDDSIQADSQTARQQQRRTGRRRDGRTDRQKDRQAGRQSEDIEKRRARTFQCT